MYAIRSYYDTSQWDNGENAYDELTRMMKVREIAISNFGENTIPEGTPYSDLENVLVPIYFYPVITSYSIHYTKLYESTYCAR